MAIKFYPNSSSKKLTNDTYINLWVQVRKGAMNFRGQTGLRFPYGWWDKDRLRNSILLNEVDGELYSKISDGIAKLFKRLNEEVLNGPTENLTNEYCREVITEVVDPASARNPLFNIPTDIIDYCNWIIRRMSNGEKKKNDSKSYSEGTIKSWIAFSHLFESYMKQRPSRLTWDEINKNVIDDFVKWMEKEDYMLAAINKRKKELRTLIGFALRDGVHQNTLCLNMFQMQKIQVDDAAAKVVLTKNEYDGLLSMSLDGFDKKVRDVFVVGLASCQRVSDYGRLTSTNFEYNEDEGILYLNVNQEKTDKAVQVPIVDKRIIDIVKSYNYSIPNIAEQVICRDIKQILHKLSDSIPSLKTEYTTLLTKQEKDAEKKNEEPLFKRNDEGVVVKPKWMCVTTHTARRTGLTLLYNTGLLSNEELRSISGHSSEKMLMKYLFPDGVDRHNRARLIAQKLKAGSK